MHLVNKKTLASLTLIWKTYEQYLKDLKPTLKKPIEMLSILNQISTIASIFSCQEPDDEINGLTIGALMVSVTDLTYLNFFHEKLTKLSCIKSQSIVLKPKYDRNVTLISSPDYPWYSVWILSWAMDDKNQELVWDSLIEAANATMAKYKEDSNLIG